MTLLNFDKTLKQPGGFDKTVARTHQGQAHFADASLGTQCGQCEFWGLPGKNYRKSPTGRPNDRPCSEFKRLSPDIAESGLPKVPHDAIACKYFARKP